MIKLVDGIASSLILIHVGKVLKRWHWKEGVTPVATSDGKAEISSTISSTNCIHDCCGTFGQWNGKSLIQIHVRFVPHSCTVVCYVKDPQ